MDKQTIAVVMIVAAFMIGALFFVVQAGAGGIESSKVIVENNYPYGGVIIDANRGSTNADVIISYKITFNTDSFADKNVKVTLVMLDHIETNMVDLSEKTGQYSIQNSFYLHKNVDCTMVTYIDNVHQTPDTVVTGFRLSDFADGYYRCGLKVTNTQGNIIYFNPADFYFVKSGDIYGFRNIGLADTVVDMFAPTNYKTFSSNGFGPTPAGAISLTWDIDFFYVALFLAIWTIFIAVGVFIVIIRRS